MHDIASSRKTQQRYFDDEIDADNRRVNDTVRRGPVLYLIDRTNRYAVAKLQRLQGRWLTLGSCLYARRHRGDSFAE